MEKMNNGLWKDLINPWVRSVLDKLDDTPQRSLVEMMTPYVDNYNREMQERRRTMLHEYVNRTFEAELQERLNEER